MPVITAEDDEAVNLLSLDGGGVRGVSSLIILDSIMKKIRDMYGLDEVPKPCENFHMIGGTSTGGLIAIMLGRLRMSTEEALQAYYNCASKIFSRENRKKWRLLSQRFQATALQEVVESLVKERGMGELMRDPECPTKGKVFVCVLRSGSINEPRLVRSYPGDPGVDDQWDKDIKIWEAARATTAASSFFKPQILGTGATAKKYIDAAFGYNNPVEFLLKEAVDEFGSGRRLGCVVSIGTGTQDVGVESDTESKRGFSYYRRLFRALKTKATDTEDAHSKLASRLSSFPGSYYRLNVPRAAETVKLHYYRKLSDLKSMTENYLEREEVAEQVQEIAEGLKTDCFDHGLTLGLIHGLDKDQIALSNKKVQVMGSTSPFFTGRQDLLKRLESVFSERNTGGKPRREFLLYGMGGVGKTEVALKFSELYEKRFKYIFYIDGTDVTTISQSYAGIARRHGQATSGTTKVMQSAAMQWIEGLTDEWLMIFDDCNLDDRRGYLPGRAKGNIIYTSRQAGLRDSLPHDCAAEVAPLEEADAT
ncbi:hypothetical protein VTI74DRAFT_7582 [Chaetomium olivicolor]